MAEDHGQEGETKGVRGEEERPDLWTDTDSSSNAGRVSQGVRNQRVSLNREGSKEGDILGYAVGGMQQAITMKQTDKEYPHLKEYAAELAGLENTPPATIELLPLAAIAIISHIQLATRHPQISASSMQPYPQRCFKNGKKKCKRKRQRNALW